MRTDALVLVNSASAEYVDFQHYIQPYLDNFGVPYEVRDIATSPVPANVGDYSLLITGHRQLDVGGTYLDAAEQDAIAAAVNHGTGLVNLDNDLWTVAGAPRYQFVQSVFNFARGGSTTGSGVTFVAAGGGSASYITARHAVGETISTGVMGLARISLPSTATGLAFSGDQPVVAVTSLGAGHAVQWGSYDWASHSVLGPLKGLDDVLWRSLAWAAHKPFVMQALPPLATMRVDDEEGPFSWVSTANQFGFKPWVGLFLNWVNDTEAADLSAFVNDGQATAGVHAFETDDWFYSVTGTAQNYSDTTMTANFAYATDWMATRDIPISKFVVSHYYVLGTNVFTGLQAWGVEYVGTVVKPGDWYTTSPWLDEGPYRRFETGAANSPGPLYYADFVDGHSWLFNCLTEIRDENGYEWYPNNDVAATIGHGTRQLTRAFDSRVLGTLFSHGEFVHAITPANWSDILQGIDTNIAGYDPVYLTMDDACRYVRAVTTSEIASGTHDAAAQTATTVLTGSSDVATVFSLFTQNGDQIEERRVDVPAFAGSKEIVASNVVTYPQISDVTAGEPSTSAATVSWTTDEPATSQVQYGTTTAYGSQTALDSTLVTAHAQVLTGLSPNTVYHYRVLSRDGAGNLSTGTDSTFTTAAVLPTLTISAPTGSGSYAAGSSLTVSWTSSPAPPSGEFAVWARSAAGGWYIGDLVAASASTSYSRAITLNVPAGTGYQAIVSWRPTAGSGAWLAFATQTGSFAVTAALPTLTISAPTGSGSYAAGSSLTVSWTSSPAPPSGEFAVWARSAAGGWYIGDLVAASASTSYSRAITLNVPAGTGYQAIVSWRPTAGSGAWLAFATQTGSFAVTAALPTLTISAPTGSGSYAAGSSLTVSWTSSPAPPSGEFAVWARSAAGGWYIGDLVAASASTSYSRAITLNVPAGTGYQAIVSWRPTAGSGAWLAFATQTGSFAVTAALPTLTISAPTGSGSYAAGSSLTVSWTSSPAPPSGEFAVWARSAAGGWYIGDLVAASASTSYSRAITLNVPAGTGYQAIVSWRPTAGSGAWLAFATQTGSFAVTAALPTLTISAPTGSGSYAAGSSLTVSWTSSPAPPSGEFAVWARSAAGGWYIGDLVAASASTSYSRAITLNVPAGTGYQAIVSWRPTAGSGAWLAFATQTGSFAVTSP